MLLRCKKKKLLDGWWGVLLLTKIFAPGILIKTGFDKKKVQVAKQCGSRLRLVVSHRSDKQSWLRSQISLPRNNIHQGECNWMQPSFSFEAHGKKVDVGYTVGGVDSFWWDWDWGVEVEVEKENIFQTDLLLRWHISVLETTETKKRKLTNKSELFCCDI